MERPYLIIEKENTEAVRGFLSKNGQSLLPLVEQVEQAEVALVRVDRRAGTRHGGFFIFTLTHFWKTISPGFPSLGPIQAEK